MKKYKYDFRPLLSEIDINTIGLKDLVKVVEGLSVNWLVEDNKEMPFPDNWITLLHSGYVTINDVPIPAIAIASSHPNVRILDKTVAANFLTGVEFKTLLEAAIVNDIKNNSLDLSIIEGGIENAANFEMLKRIIQSNSPDSKSLEIAVKIASEGFLYEPRNGAWAIISGKFVRSTPITSKIEMIVPEANKNGIWGQTEVPTMLGCLDDSHKIGNSSV